MKIYGERNGNPRLEQVEIVVIRNTYSWQSVPQGSSSWEDVQLEFTCQFMIPL